MKIAVTGSSGDVCTSVVAQALREGHHVLALDVVEPGSESLERVHSAAEDAAERFEFRKTDMQDYDQVLAAFRGCDALVHGAALATTVNIPNAVTHNTNVTCSYNALRAGIEAGMTRITQLSSINCIGSLFTPYARQYHYLPLDEKHPYEPADPYALSKMICEVQADSLVRTFPLVRIASIRPHACLHKRPKNPLDDPNTVKYGREVDHFCTANINDLWGWTAMDAVARACLLGITSEGWTGSEAFYIVAPTTKIAEEEKPDRLTSVQLAEKYHPKAPLKPGYFEGKGRAERGFYDTSKAERLLGWRHDL